MRSADDKKIAGVCGGFAEYLDVDPTLVRVAWVMLALLGGWGVLGYVVAWIILPVEKPAEKSACAEAHSAPPHSGSTATGSSPAVS